MYRNTKEITVFASNFIGAEDRKADTQPGSLELFPDFFDFHGPKPEMSEFKDFNSITDYVTGKIREIVNIEKCPFSEIAVIYTMKSPIENLKQPLPIMFEKALESNGILSKWASENYRAKKSFDITTNSVAISTIHSLKGLDYSCVFLVGLDFLENKRGIEEQITRLTYVAITRARYQLFIPYINKSPLMDRY